MLLGPPFQGGDGFRRDIANEDVWHAASSQYLLAERYQLPRGKNSACFASKGHDLLLDYGRRLGS